MLWCYGLHVCKSEKKFYGRVHSRILDLKEIQYFTTNVYVVGKTSSLIMDSQWMLLTMSSYAGFDRDIGSYLMLKCK